MPQCSASGCGNSSFLVSPRQATRDKVSFHIFPKDPKRLNSWLKALNKNGWVQWKVNFLCSDHFKEDDFNRTLNVMRLRDDAVPTIFPKRRLKRGASLPQHPNRQEIKRRKVYLKPCRMCLVNINLEDSPFVVLKPEGVGETNQSIIILDKINTTIPEMDLNITMKPIICYSCNKSLQEFYKFKVLCLETENWIAKYVESYPGSKLNLANVAKMKLDMSQTKEAESLNIANDPLEMNGTDVEKRHPVYVMEIKDEDSCAEVNSEMVLNHLNDKWALSEDPLYVQEVNEESQDVLETTSALSNKQILLQENCLLDQATHQIASDENISLPDNGDNAETIIILDENCDTETNIWDHNYSQGNGNTNDNNSLHSHIKSYTSHTNLHEASTYTKTIESFKSEYREIGQVITPDEDSLLHKLISEQLISSNVAGVQHNKQIITSDQYQLFSTEDRILHNHQPVTSSESASEDQTKTTYRLTSCLHNIQLLTSNNSETSLIHNKQTSNKSPNEASLVHNVETSPVLHHNFQTLIMTEPNNNNNSQNVSESSSSQTLSSSEVNVHDAEGNLPSDNSSPSEASLLHNLTSEASLLHNDQIITLSDSSDESLSSDKSSSSEDSNDDCTDDDVILCEDTTLEVIDVDQITCRACRKYFDNEESLISHIPTHYDIKRRECRICDTILQRKLIFKYHMSKHGILIYNCIICQELCENADELKQHKLKQHK